MRIKRLSEYTNRELNEAGQTSLALARKNLQELRTFTRQQEEIKKDPKRLKNIQRHADRQGFSKAIS